MKEEIDDITGKHIRNLLDWKKKIGKSKKIRDIRSLFKHDEEENYYKPIEHIIYGVIIISNKKTTMIKIKYYQLKNINRYHGTFLSMVKNKTIVNHWE